MKFCKITKTNDYKKIFSQQKWQLSESKAFSINYSLAENESFSQEKNSNSVKSSIDTPAYFGVITSKKCSKKAVVRNQIKRRFRHIASNNVDLFRGLKLIVVARPEAATKTYQQLNDDFVKTVSKINKRIKSEK